MDRVEESGAGAVFTTYNKIGLDRRRARVVPDPPCVFTATRIVPDDHVGIDFTLQPPGKRRHPVRTCEGTRRFLPHFVVKTSFDH
jgi:hypothetical protein